MSSIELKINNSYKKKVLVCGNVTIKQCDVYMRDVATGLGTITHLLNNTD